MSIFWFAILIVIGGGVLFGLSKWFLFEINAKKSKTEEQPEDKMLSEQFKKFGGQ